MKNLTIKSSLVVLSVLLVLSCKKEEKTLNNEVPSPDPYTYDSELKSSKDISRATFIISDIDMILSYLGENNFTGFFSAANQQSLPANTVTIIRDQTTKQLVVSFNNVTCRDGKVRNGSVFFDYSVSTNVNASYYRDYGFAAKVMFANYSVDGWTIELFNSASPAIIKNTLSSTFYDPATTYLNWEISGKFKMTPSTAPDKFCVWDGTLSKTLANSDNSSVFNPNKNTAINWNIANLSYNGTIKGSTERNTPFTYEINSTNPIVRSFNCSYSPPATIGVTDFHPFIGGVALFTTSNFHPRTINYGPTQDCDNKINISFKGETYSEAHE